MAHGTKEEATQITIPALGRHARIGYLYDERTDQFSTNDVFSGPVKGNAIDSRPISETNLEVSHIDTNREKFSLLKLSGSIQANLLSGILQVTGSAAFLQEKKNSAREVKGVMVYQCATSVENLQFQFDELKDQYNTKVLNQKGFTHIVTEITWGGNVTIDFSNKVDDEKDIGKIKGELDVVFEKATAGITIKGKASGKSKSSEIKSSTEFSLKIVGDFLLPKETPTTPEEIQNLIKQVPELIGSKNNGKGVPLKYTLTPLGSLRKYLEQTTQENEFAQKLDETILNDFINIFEKISETDQKLNDCVSDFKSCRICVPPEAEKGVVNLKEDFTLAKIKFQGQMKETIIAVRMGTMKQEAMAKITEEYKTGDFSPAKVLSKLVNWDTTVSKVQLYKKICKKYPDVKYLGYGSNLRAAFLGNTRSIIYVLYLFPESPEDDAQNFRENENLFFCTLNHPFNKLFVVDCEFKIGQSSELKRTVIQQIVDGKVNIEDVNAVVKQQKICDDPLEIKALGREFKIGQLYDARTDTFLKDKFLFAPEMPESVITVVKKSGLAEVSSAVPSEKLSDKFKALNVEPETQYNILAELSSLSRSGQYLAKSENSYAKGFPAWSFVHFRRLSEEYLSLSKVDVKHFVANALSKGATHFVLKINYGLLSIFSAQKQRLDENDDNVQEGENVLGNLKSFANDLQRIVKRIQIPSSESSMKALKVDVQKLSEEFIVKVYSDIQGEEFGPEVIQGNDDLLFFLECTFLEKQINKNQGKGMPIEYVLYPIANLANAVGILSPFITYGKLSEHFPNPNKLFEVFEEIDLARNQINQISKLLEANDDCVTDEDFSCLQNIREEFDSTIGEIQKKIKNVIKSIKKGEKYPEELKKLLSDYKQLKIFDISRRYKELNALDAIKEKIQMLKQFKKNGIVCIGRSSSSISIQEILADKMTATLKSYFLMYHFSWTKRHHALWSENRVTFLNLSTDICNKLYVVNCEFDHEICKTIDKPTIYEHKNGSLTSTDYVATKREMVQTKVKEESDLEMKLRILQEMVQSNVQIGSDLERRVNKTQASTQTYIEKVQRKLNDLAEKTDAMGSRISTINSNINDAVQSTVQQLESKIRSLETNLDNLKSDTLRNAEQIETRFNKVDSDLSVLNNVQALDSGGILNLPTKGSVYLKYKESGQKDEEKRCLWILECKDDNNYYTAKLRISFLRDSLNLSCSSNTLSYYYEDRCYDTPYSCNILSKSSLPSKIASERHFLYFYSKRRNPGAEFILQVDVINSTKSNLRCNVQQCLFNTVPGSVTLERNNVASIFVIPKKSIPYQFTVEYTESNKTDKLFNYFNLEKLEFNIYELCEGELRILRNIKSGDISSLPVSFSSTTTCPIVAFANNVRVRDNWKFSWK